jgi:AhpD family alkylhydroperoxidase
MEERIKALVAIGASAAVNCRPCVEYHLEALRSRRHRSRGRADSSRSRPYGGPWRSIQDARLHWRDHWLWGPNDQQGPEERQRLRLCVLTCGASIGPQCAPF